MNLLSVVIVLSAARSTAGFTSAPIVSRAITVSKMVATEDEYYIDEKRRSTMNLILLGSSALTFAGLAVPYFAFLYPPVSGNGGLAVTAQDALGNEISAKTYIASKPALDRSLVLGLNGDPTYLIVKEDKTLESYALNAICTHLGCVVPWYPEGNKFQCPCHGSQYAPDGHVIRGPAPLPFALAHCDVDAKDNMVKLSKWTETDFRTGEKGWWT